MKELNYKNIIFDDFTKKLNFCIGFLSYCYIAYFVFNISYFISGIVTGDINNTVLQQCINSIKVNYFYVIIFAICFLFLYRDSEFSNFLDKVFFSKTSIPAFVNVGFIIIGIYTSVTSASILTWISATVKNDENGNNIYPTSMYEFGFFMFAFLLLSYCQIRHLFFLKKEESINRKNIEDKNKEHNDKIKLAEDTLSEKIAELESVIRLAPPGDFASLYESYADKIEDWAYVQAAKSSLDNKVKLSKFWSEFKLLDIEDCNYNYKLASLKGCYDLLLREINNNLEKEKKHIRATLIAMTRLASTFDNSLIGSGRSEYRANIMLKIKRDIYTEDILDSTNKFLVPSIIKNEDDISFFLYLNKEYSIHLYTEDKTLVSQCGNVRDFKCDDLKNKLFPVFEGEDDYIYNCFGAPRAILSGVAQFIPDTLKSVDEWEKENPGAQLLAESRDYYLQSKKGNSILSIPLSHSRLSNHLETTGTINIYRNNTKLLSGDESKAEQFVSLLTPLTQALSRMMTAHTRSVEILNRLKEIKMEIDKKQDELGL
ncbi:hypothetical protein [Photobacterium leiognathi]|uniref:hypothetical protein n=1 Tax=Photobacterium leiognathi TaxID=553611 RepID=UPI002980C4C5|nr:hypothetical protein [Photobacterium leiognathi]